MPSIRQIPAILLGCLLAASAATSAQVDDTEPAQERTQGAGRGQTTEKSDGKAERRSDERRDDGREDQGAKPAPPPADPAKADAITLERLFPEKGLFGPVASSTEISIDGRYGAFLYRPHVERRHGTDLWLHDFDTGATKRVTMVSVMSAFQEDARKVRDDRVKKVKEKRKGDAGKLAAGDASRRGEEPPKRAEDAAADAISGTWSGPATTEGTDLLPPDGAEITLELRRGGGDSISGVVKSAFGTVAIAEGVFEVATGRLAGTLRFEQKPITARLEAVIKDGALEGTISIDGSTGVVRFVVRRTKDGKAPATEVVAASGEPAPAGTAGQSGPATAEPDTDHVVRFTARDLGDWVDEKDADDEKAPRYGGVSSIAWSPTKPELIFTAAGDLYLYDAATEGIRRLTRSREDERGVEWLPDGSGFTYLRPDEQRGDQILRVRLDRGAGAEGTSAAESRGAVEELNPRLPQGERMAGYRLSPDGRRLVMLATKGDTRREGRQVTIVNYRERFAQAQQVARTVSDDPLPEVEESIYVYDLGEHESERGLLKKVYSRKRTGPRDVLQVPYWAPDSSRAAFSVFDQASGRIEIMEAAFEPVQEKPAEAKSAEGKPEEGKPEGRADEEPAKAADAAAPPPGAPASLADLREPPTDPKPAFEIREARPVYRFLHNGGPNTPRLVRPMYMPDSRRLVFITELSGFRQLHVLDPVYEQLDPLTRGRFEIYPLAMSKDHRRLFALATREDPAQQQVYRIDLDSPTTELVRLTPRDGFHDGAAVSDDGTRVLTIHADFGSLRDLYAVDARSGRDVRLTDCHPEEAKKLAAAVPELFTYRNRHGHEIHGSLFRPDDWTPNDRRPLLIYVYGGPLGQRKLVNRGSTDASSYLFAMYMAKVRGWVTCTIDPRGVSGYGGLFEKSNYEQVGKPQVEDLVDGVKWLVEQAAVDPKRVGIHGWSFGGFQTQMCLYTEPEVFALGIAGAGPTEWENYNAWYSTGTIGPSRTGQTDLSKFSLLPLAKNLKGRLLLVHGVEDSNVLYQDTVRVYRELLKAGKEALVDLFIDPTGGHGLGGDVKTLNRFRKFEDFLLTHLGKGEAAPPMGPPAPESAEQPDAVAVGGGASATPTHRGGEEEKKRAGEPRE